MEALSIHIVLCKGLAINVSCPCGPVNKKLGKVQFELAYVNYTRIEYVSSVPILSKVLETIGIGWHQLAQPINPGRRSVRQSPKVYERVCCAFII